MVLWCCYSDSHGDSLSDSHGDSLGWTVYICMVLVWFVYGPTLSNTTNQSSINMDYSNPLYTDYSLYQSVSVCISLYQSVSVCISLYQSVSVCISLYQSVSVCISVYQSVSVLYNVHDEVKAKVQI